VDTSLYVGFSRGSGLLPRLILYFTKGSVNHAFLTWRDEHLGWVVLGANGNGVTLDTWANFTKTRTVPAVYKPATGSLWFGLETLRNDINAKYNIPALVGMSVVEIASHVFKQNIDNPLDVDYHDMFCSEFAVMVIRASGFTLFQRQPADTVDPQSLMTELSSRKDFMAGTVPA
jgi:hypothetical protein